LSARAARVPQYRDVEPAIAQRWRPRRAGAPRRAGCAGLAAHSWAASARAQTPAAGAPRRLAARRRRRERAQIAAADRPCRGRRPAERRARWGVGRQRAPGRAPIRFSPPHRAPLPRLHPRCARAAATAHSAARGTPI